MPGNLSAQPFQPTPAWRFSAVDKTCAQEELSLETALLQQPVASWYASHLNPDSKVLLDCTFLSPLRLSEPFVPTAGAASDQKSAQPTGECTCNSWYKSRQALSHSTFYASRCPDQADEAAPAFCHHRGIPTLSLPPTSLCLTTPGPHAAPPGRQSLMLGRALAEGPDGVCALAGHPGAKPLPAFCA